MIAIIDYGMGNLQSVQKGFEKVGFPAIVTADPKQVVSARGIVLPGVGAFEDAIKNLKESGFVEIIKQSINKGKPFLGICLGMQLLFRESEENGLHFGLDVFPGRVVKFNLPKSLKVPHMGWNQIQKKGSCPILKNVPTGAYFYFVHSYYVLPEDDETIGAVTDYGMMFSSVVGKDQVFGIQFHPEKSSDAGLVILKNFGEMVYQ